MKSAEGNSLARRVLDALARSAAPMPPIAKNFADTGGTHLVRLKLVLSITVALVSLGGAVSCSVDAPSAPAAPPEQARPQPSGASRLETPITVNALQRTTPLPVEQTASAHIGILGGHLSLPGAGLTILVPPLAVVTPVTITVTALAGSNVAYEFSPRGISFLTPLIATQDLSNTQASAGGLIDPLLLYVGYFPDSSHVTTVTELLDLQVNLLAQTSTALLWHFSGYMWSSGQASDGGDIGASSVRRRAGGGIAFPSLRSAAVQR